MVVTPDSAFDGEVLVEGSMITCVGTGGVCGALPAAMGATYVITNGVIAPGIIDPHNHILFDIFDDSDWLPSQLSTNSKTLSSRSMRSRRRTDIRLPPSRRS